MPPATLCCHEQRGGNLQDHQHVVKLFFKRIEKKSSGVVKTNVFIENDIVFAWKPGFVVT